MDLISVKIMLLSKVIYKTHIGCTLVLNVTKPISNIVILKEMFHQFMNMSIIEQICYRQTHKQTFQKLSTTMPALSAGLG